MNIRIDSAGISAIPGMPAAKNAVSAMMHYRIDLSSHRSKRLDVALIDWADHILCMNPSQVWQIQTLYPDTWDKTSQIPSYSVGIEGLCYDAMFTLSPPERNTLEHYLACADNISQAIQKLKLRLQLNQGKEKIL